MAAIFSALVVVCFAGHQTTHWGSSGSQQSDIGTDWNTVSASHDLEGNLTGDGNFTFAYDYENRLVDVTGTGTQVSSSYAGDGGRVARSSIGETRIHVLDHGVGLQPVLMEVGTNGVPVRYYIWAGVLAAPVGASGIA